MITFIHPIMLAALVVLGSAISAGGQAPKDLGKHPYFKLLIGDWTSSGELKGQDGNIVTVTEIWSGKPDGDNSFLIEGTRTVNGEEKAFTWIVTYNPTTDGYEAVYSSNDNSDTLRFESTVSEESLTMDMKAITGGGNSAIILTDSFTDDTKDTLETKVTFTGDQGETTLEGVITHKRVKQP